MKNYFKLPCLAVFAIPFTLKAQTNFKPGYIINLKGDTLKGFVDYREWERNPASVNFRTTVNSATEKYTVENSQGFALTGYEYYERFTVRISQQTVDVTRASTEAMDSASVVNTVFLKLLTRGDKISLYSYSDEIKTRFYIKEKSGVPQELVYKLFFNESGSLQTVNRYRVQLQYLVQKNNIDDAGLSQQILKAEYNEHDLLSIAKKINGDKGHSFTPKSNGGKQFFVGTGVNYSTFKFTGSSALFPGMTENSILPQISAGLDLFFNNNTRVVYFRAEVSLSGNSFSYPPTPIATGSSTPATATLKINQYTFSVTPQFIYNFYSQDNFKIFIGGGARFNISKYNNSNFVITYGTSSSSTQNYPEFRSMGVSIPLKAGVTINNKLEFNAGYTFPLSIVKAPYLSSLAICGLGVNFLFGK
ncbi:outer membrane beta-barrel protein [Mucilaginibacter boryungensis]|uniref:Outer membrane beta-barrel protein n=1 Tax=Mucilaginibacter boryungensis TaxID=768480 RepID=A0ABR9XMK5_9SPHI|nr:outer membrane beta-barrel protein [Mucilaginibacter boryungensis]MBE9668598.1 outer membrane beta-barrel protein [Mucilaginibacter boryungensis]